MGREVVAIEANVQLAQGNLDPLDLLDLVNEHLREKVASRDDAHEREVVRALVGLEDLVRHARHRSLDVVCIHADRLDHALVVRSVRTDESAKPRVRVFRELRAAARAKEKARLATRLPASLRLLPAFRALR